MAQVVSALGTRIRGILHHSIAKASPGFFERGASNLATDYDEQIRVPHVLKNTAHRVLLPRLVLRFEFAVIRGTNRFFECVWLCFVLLEFMYVVLLDVELAFADIAAVLAFGIVRIRFDFMRRKHPVPNKISPHGNPDK